MQDDEVSMELEPGSESFPEPEAEPAALWCGSFSIDPLALGEEVRLLEDPVALRAAFARFLDAEDGGGEERGIDDDMDEGGQGRALGDEFLEQLVRAGVGVITEVWEPDRTVTLRLEKSSEQLECPFEAIARKTGRFDPGFDWARAKYTVGQTVQLIGDHEVFRGAFSRFDGDEDENDWSEAKQAYHLGAIGTVAAVFDDKTLTLQFVPEFQKLDFPFEAIDLDATAQLGAATAAGSSTMDSLCPPC